MSHTTTLVVSGGSGGPGGPPYRVVGSQKEITADVTWTSTYVTFGEAVPASELGLNVIEEVVSLELRNPQAAMTAVECTGTISANGGNLQVGLSTATGEVANGAAASGAFVRVKARGH